MVSEGRDANSTLLSLCALLVISHNLMTMSANNLPHANTKVLSSTHRKLLMLMAILLIRNFSQTLILSTAVVPALRVVLAGIAMFTIATATKPFTTLPRR
jgi:hypothetical protein